MTTTSTTGTWTLRGISAGRATCDHCGRNLARCFLVESPEGKRMTVGRTCSKRLTGYDWTVRVAERAAAFTAAEERNPDLYRALDAEVWKGDENGRRTYGSVAQQAVCALADFEQGRWQEWQGDVVEYARECLTAAIAENAKYGYTS
jgi:hypothetical protein